MLIIHYIGNSYILYVNEHVCESYNYVLTSALNVLKFSKMSNTPKFYPLNLPIYLLVDTAKREKIL